MAHNPTERREQTTRRTVACIAVVASTAAIFLIWLQSALGHTTTPYFTIDLPAGWQIRELPLEKESTDPIEPTASTDGSDTVEPIEPTKQTASAAASPYSEFEVLSPESKPAFVVTVDTTGPKFIQCFCGPWENYKLSEKNGLKYADWNQAPSHRTLKIVGNHYSTDVHLSYGKSDASVLDQIIESIQPY